jgi:hypothetical protein
VVKETDLILFDSLCDSILEDLAWGSIFQGEYSLDHFVAVVKFVFSEVIFIPGMNKKRTSC